MSSGIVRRSVSSALSLATSVTAATTSSTATTSNNAAVAARAYGSSGGGRDRRDRRGGVSAAPASSRHPLPDAHVAYRDAEPMEGHRRRDRGGFDGRGDRRRREVGGGGGKVHHPAAAEEEMDEATAAALSMLMGSASLAPAAPRPLRPQSSSANNPLHVEDDPEAPAPARRRRDNGDDYFGEGRRSKSGRKELTRGALRRGSSRDKPMRRDRAENDDDEVAAEAVTTAPSPPSSATPPVGAAAFTVTHTHFVGGFAMPTINFASPTATIGGAGEKKKQAMSTKATKKDGQKKKASDASPSSAAAARNTASAASEGGAVEFDEDLLFFEGAFAESRGGGAAPTADEGVSADAADEKRNAAAAATASDSKRPRPTRPSIRHAQQLGRPSVTVGSDAIRTLQRDVGGLLRRALSSSASSANKRTSSGDGNNKKKGTSSTGAALDANASSIVLVDTTAGALDHPSEVTVAGVAVTAEALEKTLTAALATLFPGASSNNADTPLTASSSASSLLASPAGKSPAAFVAELSSIAAASSAALGTVIEGLLLQPTQNNNSAAKVAEEEEAKHASAGEAALTEKANDSTAVVAANAPTTTAIAPKSTPTDDELAVAAATSAAASLALPPHLMRDLLPDRIHDILQSTAKRPYTNNSYSDQQQQQPPIPPSGEAIGEALLTAATDAARLVEAALVEGPLVTEALQAQLLEIFTTLQHRLVGGEEEVDGVEGSEDGENVEGYASASGASDDGLIEDGVTSTRAKRNIMRNASSAAQVVSPSHPLHHYLVWHTRCVAALLQAAHTLASNHRRPLPAAAASTEALLWHAQNDIAAAHRKANHSHSATAAVDTAAASAATGAPPSSSSTAALAVESPTVALLSLAVKGTAPTDAIVPRPTCPSPAAKAYRLRRRRHVVEMEGRVAALRLKRRLLDDTFLRDVAALVELSSLVSPLSSSSLEGGGSVSGSLTLEQRAEILRAMVADASASTDAKSENTTAAAPVASLPYATHRLFATQPAAARVLVAAYLPLYSHLRQEIVTVYDPLYAELRRIRTEMWREAEAARQWEAANPSSSSPSKGWRKEGREGEENDDDAYASGSADSEGDGYEAAAYDSDGDESVASFSGSDVDADDNNHHIAARRFDSNRNKNEKEDDPLAAIDELDGASIPPHPSSLNGNSNTSAEATTSAVVATSAAPSSAGAVVVGQLTAAALTVRSHLSHCSAAADSGGKGEDGTKNAINILKTVAENPNFTAKSLVGRSRNGIASFSSSGASSPTPLSPTALVLQRAVAEQQKAQREAIVDVAHSTLALSSTVSSVLAVATWRRADVLRQFVVEEDSSSVVPIDGRSSSDKEKESGRRREMTTAEMQQLRATRLLSRPEDVVVPTFYRAAFPPAAVAPLMAVADSVRFVGASRRLVAGIAARNIEAAAAASSASSPSGNDTTNGGVEGTLNQLATSSPLGAAIPREMHKEVVSNIRSSLQQVRPADAYPRLANRGADTSTTIDDHRRLLRLLYTHAKASAALGHHSATVNSFEAAANNGSAIDPRLVHRWLQQHIRCHEIAADDAFLRVLPAINSPNNGGAQRIPSFLGTLSPAEAKRLAVIIGASVSVARATVAAASTNHKNSRDGGDESGGLNIPHIEASHRKVLSLIAPLVARQVAAEAASLAVIVSEARGSGGADGLEDEMNENEEKRKQRLRLPTTEFSSMDEVRMLIETLRISNAPAQSPLTTSVASLAMAWLSAHSYRDSDGLARMAELAAASSDRAALAAFVGVGRKEGTANASDAVISPLEATASSRAALLRPVGLRDLRQMFQQLADPQWLESPLLLAMGGGNVGNANNNFGAFGEEGGGNGVAEDASAEAMATLARTTNAMSIADALFAAAARVAKRRVYKSTGHFAFVRRQLRAAERGVEHYRHRLEQFNSEHPPTTKGGIIASANSKKTATKSSNSSEGGVSDELVVVVAAGGASAAEPRHVTAEAQRAHLERRLAGAKKRLRTTEAALRSARAANTATIRSLLGLYLDGLSTGQRGYLLLRNGTASNSLVGGGGAASLIGGNDGSTPAALAASGGAATMLEDWNVRQQRMSTLLQRLMFAPKYHRPLASASQASSSPSYNHHSRRGNQQQHVTLVEGKDGRLVPVPAGVDALRQSVALSVGELAKFLETALLFTELPTAPATASALYMPSSSNINSNEGASALVNEDSETAASSEQQQRQLPPAPVPLEMRIAHYLLGNTMFSSLSGESAAIRLVERAVTAQQALLPAQFTSDYASARQTAVSLPPLLPEPKLLARAAVRAVELLADAEEKPKAKRLQLQQQSSLLLAEQQQKTRLIAEGGDTNNSSSPSLSEKAKEEGESDTPTTTTTTALAVGGLSNAPAALSPADQAIVAARAAPPPIDDPLAAMAADRGSRLATVGSVHALTIRMWQQQEQRNRNHSSSSSSSPPTPRASTMLAMLALADPKAAFKSQKQFGESLDVLRRQSGTVATKAGRLLKVADQLRLQQASSSSSDASASASAHEAIAAAEAEAAQLESGDGIGSAPPSVAALTGDLNALAETHTNDVGEGGGALSSSSSQLSTTIEALTAAAGRLQKRSAQLLAAAAHLEATVGPSIPAPLSIEHQSWLLQQLAANAATSNASHQQVARILRNVVATFNVSALDPIVVSDVFHSLSPHSKKMEPASALLVLEALHILETRAEAYLEKQKDILEATRRELDEIHFTAAAASNSNNNTKSRGGKQQQYHLSPAAEAKIQKLKATERRLHAIVRDFTIEAYRFPILRNEMASNVRGSVRRSADTASVPAIPVSATSGVAEGGIGGDSLFMDNEDGSLPDAMREMSLASATVGGSLRLSSGNKRSITVRSVRQIIPVLRTASEMTPKTFAQLSRFVAGTACVTNPSLAAAVQLAVDAGDEAAAEAAMNRLPPMVLATHVFATDAELYARQFRANNKFTAANSGASRGGEGLSRLLPTRSERDSALFLEYFVVSADARTLLVRPEGAYFGGSITATAAAMAGVSGGEGSSFEGGSGNNGGAAAVSNASSSTATLNQQTLYDVLTAFTTMASEYTSTASMDEATTLTYERRLQQAARAESRYRGSTFESLLWPTIRSHVLGEGSILVKPLPLPERPPPAAEEEASAAPDEDIHSDEPEPAPALEAGDAAVGADEEESAEIAALANPPPTPPPLPRHALTLSLREVTALFSAFAYIDMADAPVLAALIRRLQRLWRASAEVAKGEASTASFDSFDLVSGTNADDQPTAAPSSSTTATAESHKKHSSKELLPHRALVAWAHSLDAPTATAVLSGLLDGATDQTFVRILTPALVGRLSALAHEADAASYAAMGAERQRKKRLERQRERRLARKADGDADNNGSGDNGKDGEGGDDDSAAHYSRAPVPPIIEILYPSDVLQLMPTLVTLMRHHSKIYGEIDYAAEAEQNNAAGTDKNKRPNAGGGGGGAIIAASLAPALPSARVRQVLEALHSLYEGCRQALFIMFGELKLTPVERIAREQKALLASGGMENSGGNNTSDANNAKRSDSASSSAEEQDKDSLAVIASPDTDESVPLPSVPTGYYVRLIRRLLHSDLRDVEVADVCFKMLSRTGHVLQQLNGKDFTDVMHAALVFRGSVEDNLTAEDVAKGLAAQQQWAARNNNRRATSSSSSPLLPPPITELIDIKAVEAAKSRRRALFKPLVDHMWHHSGVPPSSVGRAEQRRAPTSPLDIGQKALLLRWMHSKFGFVDDELVLQMGMDGRTDVRMMPIAYPLPPLPNSSAEGGGGEGAEGGAAAAAVLGNDVYPTPIPTADDYAASLAAFKAKRAEEAAARAAEAPSTPSSRRPTTPSSAYPNAAAVSAAAAAVAAAATPPPAQNVDVNQHMSADDFFFMDGDEAEEGSSPTPTAVNDRAAAALDAEEARAALFFNEEAAAAAAVAATPPASAAVAFSSASSSSPAAADRRQQQKAKHDEGADLWDDLLMLEEDEK